MPPSPDLSAPSIDAVRAAARRLAGQAVVTPLLEAPLLSQRLGCRLLLKAEVLQRTGSFKFRGAYNRLAALDRESRRRGVVAFSSGNHAQGVAAAARLLGMPALIVMPSDAPAAKVAGTRAWGAEIVFYDREREDREARAEAITRERNAVLVRPFDDPLIIAGQGTVGLELAEQAERLDAGLDIVLVPCSGGGLVAGIATALACVSPATRIYAVEPEGFDDTTRSLAAGRRLTNPSAGQSFCDALLVSTPGELTFSINRRLLAGGRAVGDRVTAMAMREAFEQFRLVVEPGGAVALAAVLANAADFEGKTVAVVASGGNIDREVFCQALECRAESSGTGSEK